MSAFLLAHVSKLITVSPNVSNDFPALTLEQLGTSDNQLFVFIQVCSAFSRFVILLCIHIFS